MSEIRPQDILLRAGGRTLLRHGVPAWAGSNRADEYKETFTRASAQADTYVDRDGFVRKAAANVLRVKWMDLDGDGIRETPTFPLERSQVNPMLQSESFNTGWSTAGILSVTANADTAPDGTLTADRLIEDTTNGEHVAHQQLTGTADVRHAMSVHAKAGTRTWIALGIRDVNGATNSVHAYFNLATGAIGTVGHLGAGSGEQAFIEKLANGSYRCILVGACNVGDTTPVLTVGMATGDGGRIYTGDGASYVTVWGAQFEDNRPFASSYIGPTVGSQLTRAVDNFSVPVSFGRIVCSLFFDIVEQMTHDASSDTRIIAIAGANFTQPYFCVQSLATSGYRAIFDNGSGLVGSGFLSAGVYGDRVRGVARLYADGSCELERRINNGAAASSTRSSATGLTAAGWNAQTLWLGRGNGIGDSNFPAARAYIEAMAIRDTHTLAECEAVP